MPTQALYLKWRPRMFEHVIGQEHITRTLRNALIQNRIRHAYLFNGPRGTGKTTMARILAKAVNCLHPDPAARPCDECRYCEALNEGRFLDLIEIDAASHNGVDDVRDLRDKIAFAPTEGRYKVYIIDEVHRFSGAAFDALLKTLEEPPDHAIFILATTELDKVPATIRSRSLIFEFRRVSIREVADRLQMIAEFENVQVPRDVLELVARQGTGSVRDSISLLDQLISDPDQALSLEYAERVLGTSGARMVGKVVGAVLQADAGTGLALLNQAIEDGADPGQFGRQIVEYLRNLLLVQTGGPELVDTSDEARAALARQAEGVSRRALLNAVRAFNAALGEIRTGWQPQLPLELAMIESARPPAEPETYAVPVPEPKRATPTKAAPPEPPPAEDAASAEEVPVTFSLAEIRRGWPAILKDLQDANQVPLATLLGGSAAPQAIEGSTLVLGVKDGWAVPKLNDAKARTALARTIYKLFRVKLDIKAVDGGARQAALDDTIVNDPLIAGELKAGGKISQVEDLNGEGDQP